MMKTFAIVLGTIALATVLVIAGVWLGVAWTQGRWGCGLSRWYDGVWHDEYRMEQRAPERRPVGIWHDGQRMW